MLSGFLDPYGVFYACPRYGHTSKAQQIVDQFSLTPEGSYEFCEETLLKNNYIVIRATDVYKGIRGYKDEILFITDEQQKFLQENKGLFSDKQWADIYGLLKDFGRLRELHSEDTKD